MSEDTNMNSDNSKSLYGSHWHKTPNAMVDIIIGSSISASAGWVVMTVIRYTDGMSGKKSACIPAETFQRVLGINRRQTVYKFIDEAIASGLIIADKKRGCVTKYSINESCKLWRKSLVVTESGSSDNRYTSSNGKCYGVVTESATPVVTESATHIKTKENIKESIKEIDDIVVFERSYESNKNHLMIGGIIPIGKRANDDELRPEIYKFEIWCKQKGVNESRKGVSIMTWFSKFSLEDRKRFYTFPDELNRNYHTELETNKKPKVTDERAAEIRAQYMGAMGF